MRERIIDQREGRALFGADPHAYNKARPGHPDRVYKVLVEECELEHGTAVLEIGAGTGRATRRLLELGAQPLVAIEPDPALAAYLVDTLHGGLDVLVVALEDSSLSEASFDLAVAASSFHWIEEEPGLAKVFGALRPGGWWAMWWTLFGDDSRPDPFLVAVDHIVGDLPTSPCEGRPGRPRFGLDIDARAAALDASGFERFRHELIPWDWEWDAVGIRALYGTFSPIARLEHREREAVLDGVAYVAEHEFGGRVERPLLTSLYTARRPA
jgi:SAM-dependent methyltransferase